MKTIFLKTAEDTENFAAMLAMQLQAPATIFLEGELGAGKTTFAKGFLRGCGFKGLVKSPTYTLVETYSVNDGVVLHADLYRIHHSDELETMGFRDYFNTNTIALIEWASRAVHELPTPLLSCQLTLADHGEGRLLSITAMNSVSDTLREFLHDS